MKKFFVIAVIFLSLFLGKSPLIWAEREDPGLFLERMFSDGLKAVEKESSAERRIDIVREFIKSVMDIPRISLGALGSFSRYIPPEQKSEYADRFTKYFLENNRAIKTLAENKVRFKCKKTYVIDDDNAKVCGVLSVSQQTDYEVWFRMRWKDDRNAWTVINNGADGLGSSAEVYQVEFLDFVNNNYPGESAKKLIKYLDCRISGENEESCKNRLLSRRGDK